ncbi:hybrid sensor histidine kinase/response regulator transcription factor [Flavicella sediminum]|uniref:hybrid sensor histidine kinase/response regulator transcription factor n=1 Tax=Flavicella sediminum TaxID=2585141 RepID=UPI0011225E78|nr:ATP-binding protein [Flavicella sediminum]
MLKIVRFVFLFLFFVQLNAQENIFQNHKNLSILEGLSHNGVTSVLEDSKGFMWFGTFSGINRYDGYKTQTYKNTNTKEILNSNRVRTLAEDRSGNIWIGTERGITIYNTSLQKFTKLRTLFEAPMPDFYRQRIVKQIIFSERDKLVLCVSENKGIQVFTENYQFLGEYKIVNDIQETGIKITDAIKINESHVLLSSSIGLIDFNIKTRKFKQRLKKEISYASSLTPLNANRILVNLHKGISLVSYNQFEELISYEKTKHYLHEYKFTSSSIDSNGSLWLGTHRAGLIYIKERDSFLQGGKFSIEKFDDNLNVLVSSKVICTSKNTCWYATFNAGVYKFNTNENPFVKIKMDGNENKISNVQQISENKISFSAGFNGISTYHLKKLKHEAFVSNSLKNIDYLFIDSKGDYWANDIKSSFFRSKKGTAQREKFLFETKKRKEGLKKIRYISEELGENRKIWVGTRSNVFRLSIDKNDEIVRTESLHKNLILKNKKITGVRFIYPDPIYDFIWIATDHKGLFRIKNLASKKVEGLEIEQFIPKGKNKFSLSSLFVSSMVRLPNNELWLGTEGGGLCKVENSQGSPKFISFTEEDGLSNNVVKSILSDEDSNLWVSTNVGLNKVDPKSLKVTKYGKSDGLPFVDFYYGANKLKNGTLVFTGQRGICYFNPKNVSDKEEIPAIEFENLKIFDKLIHVNDTIENRVVLPKSISEVGQIDLNYNENVFSIDVISLHYSNPENHLLRYKLAPINRNWVEVPSDQNTITYSGLQAGTYELQVSVSNSLGEWSSAKKVKIVIHPPLWKTYWAFALYLVLIILISYFINRIFLKIHLLNHKIEIEQLEKDNEKEINEAKLRFFANISHEIKTPLTLISSPINNLYSRFSGNPDLGEKLSMVLRQSKKIHELIEQVQDFRRSDANMLKMRYTRFEFNSFINEVVNDFMYAAYSDKKELGIIGEETPIIVSADKNKLEKIFNNLLNNAFKYTKASDQIKVIYKSDDKDLIISFEDTGRGIDAIDVEHVFERFYQSHLEGNEHIGGSGIGLAFSKRLVEMHYGYIHVESEVGKGSKFIVKLPIVKEQELGDKLLIDQIVLPKEKEISVKNIENTKDWSTIRASGDFAKSLIFYAEDNDEMRNYITRFLAQFFKVKSFANGKECIEAFENEWPDLVISDVQMPELNGLDLCIQIKSDLKTSHIPIVLLTALTNLTDHLQGIRDGADAYIKKPFNLEQLITTIEALLINRKQLRERFQIGIPLTRDNKNSRNDNAFLEKFYSIVDENLDNQNFDLKDLASDLCLSKSTFYLKVNTLTNQTPFELIINYRLKRASEFLAQDNLSVTEVFLMTGFKSRTHFSTKFKEKYHVSPSKYAEHIQGEKE